MSPKIVGKCRMEKGKHGNTVRHEGCGGQIAVEAEMTRSLPIGMGFGLDGRFEVVKSVSKGWKGYCMKCRAEGVFMRADIAPKAVKTHPRAINNKIKKAREAMG